MFFTKISRPFSYHVRAPGISNLSILSSSLMESAKAAPQALMSLDVVGEGQRPEIQGVRISRIYCGIQIRASLPWSEGYASQSG